MQNYQISTKKTSPAAPARWRAERTPPPKQARASLEPTHATGILDVLRCLAVEYAPGPRWDAALYQAIADTPALSTAPRPDLPTAHDQAAAYLSAREAGRLMARFPRYVIDGLIMGLEEGMHHLTTREAL